jgi:hypothetical protein
MLRNRAVWLSLLATCCLGCSGAQSRLDQPGIDAGAAAAAIERYDGNGDGMIGGEELAKVPAFKAALKRIDKDGDGKVNAAEVEERLAVWLNSKLALTRVVAVVRQNGRPLPDAEVTFVPESFLGSEVKPAKGTTDATGNAYVKISDHPDERGVHLGFYRVEISKKKPDGTEAIPARYNSNTEVGVEVAPDDADIGRLIIDMRGS